MFCNSNTAKIPKLDIQAFEKNIQIMAEIPGTKKEELEVQVNDGIVKIFKHDGCQRSHRFLCHYEIPIKYDPKAIRAKFHNGILELTIEKNKSKEIPIELTNNLF